ncbi:capsular polysaccharide export protein, LipB/KpsS family [Seonamhaeicola maritimus]|uniref:Capsule biosynthesis protein n=1 Tax=Seonamhaeicola maritimus TaxID=2591822 RepID=A0A5C7GJ23_9FLAO|nr:hypothetical protein [Seonamhaeicola maritimus]TXG37155.1 hypothetical protein FUA22_11360 [Seonamhaeicola maritimus]
MIVFDLINDEAPLFIEGVEYLSNKDLIAKNEVIGITEGNRWHEEAKRLKCTNRLHYFDQLDSEKINIKKELNRISKTYDNFNLYACDRYLIKKDTNYQQKMVVYTYLFYEQLFTQGVSHYFTTGIAYTYNLISYQVSKRFKVKHISFYGTRIRNKTAISLDVSNTFNFVSMQFKEFDISKVTQEMYKPIDTFVNKPKQPLYMKNAINASTIKGVFVKEFFIRFNKFYFKGKHKYDLFTRSPFELSLFKLKKILNAKKINLLHDSIFEKPNYNEKYFIFPLHMQPEASTLVLAPFQVNQKTTIINISKLIPPNIKIYVKEHKSALGQHTMSFYKELKQYPNIKMISHNENMFDLIKGSLGTINLSSTVGLESLFLKKPSVVLGNVFYNDSGLTFKVNSYKELGAIVNQLSKDDFDIEDKFKNYSAKLAYYIYCLERNSYPFEFNVAKLDTKKRVLASENIEGFANCVKSFLNL